jgi:large subunit ribosomal protein L35
MPKLKTRKSAAKRYKITGSGKILKHKGNSKHLMEKKSAKSKKNNNAYQEVHATDAMKIARMLPYKNKKK